MNRFVTIEHAYQDKGVNFYTVRFEGSKQTEFENFLDYFEQFEEDETEEYVHFQELLAFLEQIGEDKATENYFRHERAAHAIPVKWRLKEGEFLVSSSNPIRLYCVRMNNQIVILCNGGIKTTRDPLECGNVSSYFKEACQIARKIDELLRNKEILIEEYHLKSAYNEPITLDLH